MNALPVAVGGVTLLLSLTLPFALRPLLERWGVIDVPNERSSHARPVLRGMGLAVLIAMLIGVAVATIILLQTPRYSDELSNLLIVFGGSFAAGILGWREDRGGLSVLARSIWMLLIAMITAALLLWGVGGMRAGIPIVVKILLVIYAILFLSSFINVANFMDGLNGISGFHGVIAGLTFFAAGVMSGLVWLVLAGLIIAAGFAGFLPWNLSKPGAFLGDVGSYLLGGVIAITSLAAFIAGVPMLATIGPMVIYFGDVAVTLVKRVRRGEKWYEPHKEHTYQRIQQLGYSHVQASAISALFTAIVSVLGLLQFWLDFMWPVLLLGGVVVLALYLAIPRILPARRA